MGQVILTLCKCGFKCQVSIGKGEAYQYQPYRRLNVGKNRFDNSRTAPSGRSSRIISEEELLSATESKVPLSIDCPSCRKRSVYAKTIGTWD